MRDVLFSMRSAAAAGAVAVLTLTLAGQSAASAASVSHRPGAATPAAAQHWSQVTALGSSTIDDIGLVRGSDGVLHVLWTQGGTGHETIMDTPIGPGGFVFPRVTIVGGQFAVTDPGATATPSGLAAFWNGYQKNQPTSPVGVFEATRPSRGGRWSVSRTVIPQVTTTQLLGSSDSAGTGGDGKPWVAYTGTDVLLVVHVGHPEQRIPPTSCCVYFPGLATDGKTGASYLAYMSLITGKQGIWLQHLSATGAAGSPARLPGSETGGHVPIVQERVGITGRGHGRAGVYVVYANGYPFQHAIDLLRVGTAKPAVLATFGAFISVGGDTVVAGPNGRLWATWFLGDGTPPALFVRASNDNGQNFGKAVRVGLPSGTQQILKVYTSAQAGKLDVVALLTTRNGKSAYFSTQVP